MPSGTCERCAAQRNWLHKHHIKLRCEGGTDADGILMLCANCHEDVHGGPMGGDSVRHRRHNPEVNARRAVAMQRQWSDPEYVAKVTAARNAAIRKRWESFHAEVAQLRAEGLTQEEIAMRLGRSRQSVLRSLKRHGDPETRATMQRRRRDRERDTVTES